MQDRFFFTGFETPDGRKDLALRLLQNRIRSVYLLLRLEAVLQRKISRKLSLTGLDALPLILILTSSIGIFADAVECGKAFYFFTQPFARMQASKAFISPPPPARMSPGNGGVLTSMASWVHSFWSSCNCSWVLLPSFETQVEPNSILGGKFKEEHPASKVRINPKMNKPGTTNFFLDLIKTSFVLTAQIPATVSDL